MRKVGLLILFILLTTVIGIAYFGGAWIRDSLTGTASTVTQESAGDTSLSLTLGGLTLVFLAFNFAMLKKFEGSSDATKWYSIATVASFVSACFAVLASLVFSDVESTLNRGLFSLGQGMLVVASAMFVVSAGLVTAHQVGW